MQISTSTPDTVTIAQSGGRSVVTTNGIGDIRLADERANILGARRSGDDLVIKMRNGEEVVISNYYAAPGNLDIVVTDAAGQSWLFENVLGTDQFVFEPMSGTGAGMSMGMIAAIGGGAALLALAGGGGGGSDGDTGGTPPTTDTTPPDPASNLQVNATGTLVIGRGEPGARVEIFGPGNVVIGTGTVASNGTFSVIISPAQTNGQTLQVVLIDAAGNASTPATVTAPVIDDNDDRDTTPPDPATDLAVDSLGKTLTGKGEAGAFAYVYGPGSAVFPIGQGVIGTDGNFSVALFPAQTDGQLLTVILVDAAGNRSLPATVTAIDIDPGDDDDDGGDNGDLPAPPATNLVVNPTGTVVTGKAQAGARVDVYAEGTDLANPGTPLGTAVADESGVFSVTLSTPQTQGQQLAVLVTNDSGIPSAPAYVTAPVITDDGGDTSHLDGVSIVDNDDTADLEVVASVTELGESKVTSFAVASIGLGSVLGANVLTFENSLLFQVSEGATREITFQADAGGVQVAASYNLRIMRKDASGDWVQYHTKGNYLNVALFGGKSEAYTITLPPGEYAAFAEAAGGVSVLAGYTLRTLADTVFDFNNPTAISGGTSGNVISDLDDSHGRDVLPNGGAISAVNGIAVSATGETVIQGLYGKLAIAANGSYTYTLDAGQDKTILDKSDIFHYTITNAGKTLGSATLTIELNRAGDISVPVAHAEVVLQVSPEKIDNIAEGNGFAKKTNFDVLDVGLLGPILNAAAITASTGSLFTVENGTRRDITFDADGGGVAINGRYDLRIFKKVTMTLNNGVVSENWVEYFTKEDWLKVTLGGRADEVTVSFTEGEYAVLLSGDASLALLTGRSIWATADYTYDYTEDPLYLSGSTTGTIGEAGQTVVIKSVEGIPVSAAMDSVIVGEHGVLTIKADGSYSYRVFTPADGTYFKGTPFGEIETFTYNAVVNGKVRAASLRIAITGTAQEDQTIDMTVNVTNRVETQSDDHSQIGVSYSKTFNMTFAEGTVTSLDLTGNAKYQALQSTTGERVLGFTYTLERKVGNAWEVVTTKTTTAEVYKTSLDANLGTELAAGTYRLKVEISGRASAWQANWDVAYEAVSIYPAEYVLQDVANEVTLGTLIPYGSATSHIKSIAVGSSTLASGTSATLKSMTIEGDHGTLVIKEDGSYTYTARGTTYGADTFEYVLTSVTGSQIASSVTFHVGLNLQGSAGDDIIYNTIGADIFTTGAGADTVRFAHLGDDVDVWTDFSLAEGDRLDLSALLPGLTTTTASSFVRLESVLFEGVASTKVSIMNGAEFRDLAVLKGANVANEDLDDLLVLTTVQV